MGFNRHYRGGRPHAIPEASVSRVPAYLRINTPLAEKLGWLEQYDRCNVYFNPETFQVAVEPAIDGQYCLSRHIRSFYVSIRGLLAAHELEIAAAHPCTVAITEDGWLVVQLEEKCMAKMEKPFLPTIRSIRDQIF